MGLYNKPQEIPVILGLKLYTNTKTVTLKEIKSYIYTFKSNFSYF